MNNEVHHSLTATNLSCEKGDNILFSKLDFCLQSKEVLLVVGDNGSGKTSLLRKLALLAALEEGNLHWNGVCVFQNKMHYAEQLIYIGHQHGIKPQLTVLENISLDHLLQGNDCQERVKRAIDHSGLSQHQHTLGRYLSTGQGRRLALARLILSDALLWILDEPLIGLDKNALFLFEELLQKHITKGGLAIITSHQPLNLTGLTLKTLSL